MFGSQLIDINPRFNGRDFRMPEIAGFGHSHFRHAMVTTDSWLAHPGLEVVVMLEGQACWELGDERLLQINGSQVMILPGGLNHRIVHGIYPPSRLFWLVFEPLRATETGILQPEEMEAFHRIAAAKQAPVEIAPAALRKLWDLGGLLSSPRILLGDPLLVAETRSIVYAFIIDLWKCCYRGGGEIRANQAVLAAEQIMRRDLDLDISVAEFARRAGYSRGRLHTLFKQEFGMSPNDYRQRLRVKRCCDRLARSRDTITDIALEAGFGSTQYFSRVFRKYIGATPSAFRTMATGR